MICTKCQNPLPENAKYCPNCGNLVIPKNSSSADETRRSFSAPIKSYGLIFLTMAIALFIVYLILESNSPQKEAADNISSSSSEIPDKIKVLDEQLKQDPASVVLNIDMGNNLFDTGRFSEAIKYYQQALRSDSLNVAVRIDLAVCYFNLQDYTSAIEQMDQALQIDPNHQKGLYNIGIMYMNIGKQDSTRKYWERLVTVFPESDEAKNAGEMLKKM